MAMNQFDLTPDPNVLIALTQTPLRQMDALCELVDNAIDSFSAAKRQGIVIDNPTVKIYLPKGAEINEGLGCVRVIDNGPGLTMDAAEKALRAGYSSNNQYDNLGLFGMGFNISTGKMGSITTLTTVRPGATFGMEVVIDLNELNRSKSYKVTPREIEKPFYQGTEIKVTGWWPTGNSNNGFIKALSRYSTTKVTEELGRRYASILRNKRVHIFVNDVACEAYEFCVWGANRHVFRKKHGEIPAFYQLDRVIYSQRKCSKCGTFLQPFQVECPACGCQEIRTIEEHIHGWIGIQRYDNATEYGVDLIRNGRAIRVGEKSAFFEFTDEFNKTIRDYPIDSPFGRIVGEIHLDHVPVDFLKRDFQRSTPEWQRAMSYIRGDSSLQPNQKGAKNNDSPMFKLYQGYRKVRVPGTTDMYMGYWDVSKNSPHRISREIEEEYIARFKKKEPGYFDDAKWWEQVEEADHAPAPELPICQECGAQVLATDEVCNLCGHIFKSKKCINCDETIQISAKSCPICGASQEAEILKPWKCDICGKVNASTLDNCANCGQAKGKKNTLSFEYLKSHSNRDDVLSIDSCSIQFPSGDASSGIKINVFTMTESIITNITKESLPLYVFRNEIGSLDIFVDRCHRVFSSFQTLPEVLIAAEIADRIKILNNTGNDVEGIEGIGNITWQIIEKYWSDNVEKTPDGAKNAIQNLFKVIKKRLAMTIGVEASEYFNELSETQGTMMATNIINAGIDISKVSEMKQTGNYLQYVGNDFILRLFELNPGLFFDGKVWDEGYHTVSVPDGIKSISQNQIKNRYFLCLEDIFSFLSLNISDPLFVKKTMCSVEYLEKRMITDVY